MTRSTRQRQMYFASLLFAAAPFGAALVRLVTRHDIRLLWLAIASFVGAALVAVAAKGRGGTPSTRFTLSAATLLVATLVTVLAARLLWSLSSVGVWMF